MEYSEVYSFYIVCPGCSYQRPAPAVVEDTETGRNISLPNEQGSCPQCRRWLQADDEFDLLRRDMNIDVLERRYKMPA